MPKSYNLKTTIRSALRKVWLFSPMRRQALAACRVSRGRYECQICHRIVTNKEIDVDHIVPATPPGGINTALDWGVFIQRLLYVDPQKDLRGACKECHKKKTYEERYGKPQVKKENRKRRSDGV